MNHNVEAVFIVYLLLRLSMNQMFISLHTVLISLPFHIRQLPTIESCKTALNIHLLHEHYSLHLST